MSLWKGKFSLEVLKGDKKHLYQKLIKIHQPCLFPQSVIESSAAGRNKWFSQKGISGERDVSFKCCLNCFRIFIVVKTIGLEVTLAGCAFRGPHIKADKEMELHK